MHWRQIRTKKFQLIYPESFENSSLYLANILDMVADVETRTLHAKVPRIPVILHPSSSESNGITTWAPKRIELFPCPPQDIYPEEWLEQLAIHEYRHGVQISKMNQGFTKGLFYLLGEQAAPAVLGLYIPRWFLEGDAVCTETALSKSGRGRTAAFESVLRAQLLEKKIYTYGKAVLGSYRTFLPDRYQLGYPLVAQARKIYGPDMWNAPLDLSAKLSFMIVPFTTGIRKETGMGKFRFYRKMLSVLRDDWKKQDESVVLTNFHQITKANPKDHPIYLHPVLLNDSVIIAEKESMNDPDRFMKIDRKTGKEKKILTMGEASDESISVAGNFLVWSELQPDLRWQNRSYSVIRIYDFNKRKIRNLTSKSRYFGPFLSPDATRIAAIRMDLENRCSIDILETATGRVLKSFPMERITLALTPNWSHDGSCVVFTILSKNGKSIACMNLQSGTIRYYFPFGYTEISGPAFFHNRHLLFAGDYSGITNIYAADTATGHVYQVTSARFFATDPDFTSDRNLMIYSDYNSDGLRIVSASIDTTRWIPLEKITDNSIRLYESLVRQENANIQDSVLIRKICDLNQNDGGFQPGDTIRGKTFTSKKYSKLLHLFNPHSWAPLSVKIDNLALRPGITVLSQDLLSTMTASAGWEYNINEATGKFFANLSYQGLYPVLDIGFDIGKRASEYWRSATDGPYRFTWKEMNFRFHGSIPWNFSRGKYTRSLKPTVGTTLINITHDASTPEYFTKGNIISMDYELSASQYVRSIAKDMYPRFGQALTINFRNTPFSGNSMGSIFAAQADLFFRGIFKHHGIWIYGAYQEQKINESVHYTFGDLIRYPRGFSGISDQQVVSMEFNYTLPVFYPDLPIGSIIYFKRFKLNLFYDWAQGWTGKKINIYESLGGELTSEHNILGLEFPVVWGIRTLYYPGTSSWGWQFVFGINLR